MKKDNKIHIPGRKVAINEQGVIKLTPLYYREFP